MGRKPAWPPPVTHHHASGQARVRIQGRDVYLGPFGSERATAAYGRLLAGMTGPDSPIPALTPGIDRIRTVTEVVADWWAGPAQDYSERGREAAQYRMALRPLRRLFGPTPAAEFGTDQLEQLQLAMASGSWMSEEEKAEARKKKQPVGWCRNVVNRRIVRVRTVWRWAERKKHVPPGAWAALRAVPGLAAQSPRVRHTSRAKPPTWDEVLRVAAECPPTPRSMVTLQALTGMRSGEVRIMRPCDLDRSAPVWLYRPSRHKNDWRGQDRVVPLGPECQALLAPFLEKCAPDGWVFPCQRGRPGDGDPAGEGKPDSKDPRPSRPYSTFSYAQAVRRAALAAGVKGFHPYQCRHHAKQRITRELGLDVARAVLGQKSIGTTNDYGDAADAELARRGAK